MQYTNSEIDQRIAENIHSSKYRDIMHLRYVDGLTYEKIAEISEMSPRQVWNIVKKCSIIIFPESVFTEICFS